MARNVGFNVGLLGLYFFLESGGGGGFFGGGGGGDGGGTFSFSSPPPPLSIAPFPPPCSTLSPSLLKHD